MTSFSKLWNNHVGREYVCDQKEFGNQCAMRMGKALEDSGVTLANAGLKRCSDYSKLFKDHKPGHIRSAQDLANVFYRNPQLLGANVKKLIVDGSINDNLKLFNNRNGMVFIMNGWGNTDHIDVWNGGALQLKGASNSADYRSRGQQVWFWEII